MRGGKAAVEELVWGKRRGATSASAIGTPRFRRTWFRREPRLGCHVPSVDPGVPANRDRRIKVSLVFCVLIFSGPGPRELAGSEPSHAQTLLAPTVKFTTAVIYQPFCFFCFFPPHAVDGEQGTTSAA